MSGESAVAKGVAEADIPARPRLKRGETPQSPAFKKRMQAYNRAVALAEATAAKAAQDKADAEKRAKRKVTSEVSKKPKAKSGSAKSAPRTEDKPKRALRDRTKTIDDVVDKAIKGASN